MILGLPLGTPMYLMGLGYVVVSILLYFSYAACHLPLVGSTDAGGNLQNKLKNATFARRNPFQFARRARVQYGDGNVASHFAMWHTEPGKFYGLRAEISLWGSPNLEYSQESGASILISCLEGGLYTYIGAGFHVYPSMYKNRDVRFFTYWTKDDSKSTGCYNLECRGFVPASGAALVPGQAVAPLSSYGQSERYISLSLNKYPNSGDRVLYRHDLGTPSFLGHFPGDLCPRTLGAQALAGFVNYPKNTRGPPMGSGHFPEDDDTKSAYFKHIKLYDSKGHVVDAVTTHMIHVTDKPDCYNETEVFVEIKRGYMFYYGGSSGCIG